MSKQPNDVVEFTQGIREQIVHGLTANGMPADNETTNVLLSTLDSMDRTAIGVMRIQQGNRANDLTEQALNIADRLSASFQQGPFVNVTPGVNPNAPVPGEKLIEIKPVPGAMDIGTSTQNYNEFMSGFTK